ncbi:MAG TPA: hypothetical protein VMI32_22375 [Candidatus Solibacter sp.]|nr:hypothetical protein [Candidatus Solibacter sp.]
MFLEWMLIVLVTGALSLVLRKSKNFRTETRSKSSTVSPGKGRILPLLTATLAAMVLSLGVASYLEIKKVHMLETSLESREQTVDRVKQMVDALLKDFHDRNMRQILQYDTSHLDCVKHPALGELCFPPSMPQQERNEMTARLEQAQEPLRRIREVLDKLE